MNNSLLIKEILQNTKTIAMVGVSSVKEDVPNETIIRRPSNIVMKYLQEFGYKVYPVNPFSKEKLNAPSLTNETFSKLRAIPIVVVLPAI